MQGAHFQSSLENVGANQIAHADGVSPPGFVTIAEADASHRCADRLASPRFLEGGFLSHVVGENDVRAIADLESLDWNLAPLTGDPAELFHKCLRINHNARRDHGSYGVVKNPGGQQRQLIGGSVEFDGVPGVVSAKVSHHDIMFRSQKVDDFAFGFVAPLQADDGGGTHGRLSALRSVKVGRKEWWTEIKSQK